MSANNILDIIIEMIRKGVYETGKNLHNDYPVFMKSMEKSRHPASLYFYPEKEYEEAGTQLFKLKDFDAGYALKKNGDIVSVHNNAVYNGEPVRKVAPLLVEDAVKRGGNHLDHYDFPRLNKVYEGAGLREFGRDKWNDEFKPDLWDYAVDGRPDVVYRGTSPYIVDFCSDPKNDEICNNIPADLLEEVLKKRKERSGK